MEAIRTCVGCRRRAPKGQLLRFVAQAGMLELDPTGQAAGRGAYTCRSRACVEGALRRRAFARALRRPIRVPPDLQAVSEEG